MAINSSKKGVTAERVHIPERFRLAVDQHLVLNLAGIDDWPLILGIFGLPGDGKSFQARTHLAQRQVHVVSINAADLESDRAGQPGKMVLAAYSEAGERTEQGQPAALLIDDFDTTVGEWAHSTGTVNHQQVLAQLMHLADSPMQTADGAVRRVPVLVTGNDLTKIYPPLRRPGRLRPFTWHPTPEERHDTIAALIRDVADQSGVTKLLAACPDAPISFFADLRTTILAERADSLIHDLAANLQALVKDPTRHRESLEAKIQSSRLPVEALVDLATAEWTMRQQAHVSHLED
jgi:SpoVK/Ycf46/Vps4 family AAA+-type ATPase